MKRTHRHLVHALAVAAALPPYPGLRAVNDPIVSDVLQQSQRFWDQRNVRGGPTQVFTADSLRDSRDNLDALGRAVGPEQGSAEQQIAVNSQDLGRWLAQARDKHSTRRKQRRAIMGMYGLVTHELGHARGLDHTDTGIMAPGSSYKTAPGDWGSLMKELRAQNLIPRGRRTPKTRRPKLGAIAGGGFRASG